ncbi:MAG: glycosyltransferase, partial [Eubacteriales bacterium]
MRIYVRALIKAGCSKILLVNDGSKEELLYHYQQLLEEFPEQITCVRHHVNEGKGRALKTAFHHVLNTYSKDEVVGVVTADADGQHGVEDTIHVAEELLKSNSVVLGCRDFNQSNVPPNSRHGNKITTNVFGLLYGKRVSDTQTGLRGIPHDQLARLITLKGERFEYEINTLIDAVSSKQEIIECPIETIYYDSNRATHFNAVKDSLRIYSVIFKQFFLFTCSGLTSFVVDIALFSFIILCFDLTTNSDVAIYISTIVARIISSIVNLTLNKNIVFKTEKADKTNKNVIAKYYTLCVAQFLLSAFLVAKVYSMTIIFVSLVKIIIDTLLFLVSFQIQQRWVFKGGKE